MDARVNDFFNEINEIVPPVAKVRSTSDCVWQECFDDTSGFPYYWNMLTNAVTWEIPSEYQAWLDKSKIQKTKENVNDCADLKRPLFPSVAKPPLTSIAAKGESKTISASKSGDCIGQEVKKIKVLSAYIVDSDHDSREANSLSRNGSNTNSPFHSNNSKSNSQANSDTETPDELKPTLGFSLLANYGNYSDDEEDSQEEDVQETPKTPKSESVGSTLFPITKQIDVKQFTEFTQETKEKELPQEIEEIDVKAFKRKRRIGVHLVNHPRKEEDLSNSNSKENPEGLKSKFAMTFVQGDTLQPSSNFKSSGGDANETDMVETQTTLKEKLAFLSEGRDAISPVQIMSIQLEILFVAWKSGNLNSTYFSSWIKDVSSNLIKLEEDATPEGWNLEWDRKEKRYFYRNKSTDACQWEYPQLSQKDEVKEANGAQDGGRKAAEEDEDDDAMDICTTPPPMDAARDGSNIEVTTISASATDDTHKDEALNSRGHDLNSALDSFYSDIAAIETAEQHEIKEETKAKAAEIPASTAHASVVAEVKDTATAEPAKKKKKVKMSHGISMKKKGVSQLVEKWKNVQKDLD